MRTLPQIADYAIPESEQMECRLLNEVISYPENMIEATRMVNEKMFFGVEARKIWRTLKGMYDAHESISSVTVLPRVNRNYYITNILGETALGTISEVSALANALHDLYIKREAYFTSCRALQMIGDGKPCFDIERYLCSINERVEASIEDTSFENGYEVANKLAESLQQGTRFLIKTGFPSLDYMTYGGFGQGKLIIMAARPGVGKTTLSMQIAQKATLEGIPVAVFSLEMTSEELVQRQILSTGLVSPLEMSSGNVNWQAYEQAVKMVVSGNMHINDTAKTLDEIITKSKLLWQSGKCKMLLIDYLTLIPIDKRMNTAQAYGEITRRLKLLAKDLNIPVVLLSQLNRECEKEGRSPLARDLRESGSLEQDADIILMFERGKKEPMMGENYIDMWVRKNRGGRVSLDEPIHLQGDGNYSNFTEVTY